MRGIRVSAWLWILWTVAPAHALNTTPTERDFTKLQAQLSALSSAQMSVKEYLQSLVNAESKDRQKRLNENFVKLTVNKAKLGKDFSKEFEAIMRQIGYLLGFEPLMVESILANDEKRPKILAAILEFFNIRDRRAGWKDSPSSPMGRALENLAKAYGLDDAQISVARNNLRTIGDSILNSNLTDGTASSGNNAALAVSDSSGGGNSGAGTGIPAAGFGSETAETAPSQNTAPESDPAKSVLAMAPDDQEKFVAENDVNKDGIILTTVNDEAREPAPVVAAARVPAQLLGSSSSPLLTTNSAPTVDTSSLLGAPGKGGGSHILDLSPLAEARQKKAEVANNKVTDEDTRRAAFSARNREPALTSFNNNALVPAPAEDIKPVANAVKLKTPNRGDLFLGVDSDMSDPGILRQMELEKIFVPRGVLSPEFTRARDRRSQLLAKDKLTPVEQSELQQSERVLHEMSSSVLAPGTPEWAKDRNHQCLDELHKQHDFYLSRHPEPKIGFLDWLYRCKVHGELKDCSPEESLYHDIDRSMQQIERATKHASAEDPKSRFQKFMKDQREALAKNIKELGAEAGPYRLKVTRASALLNGILSTDNPVCAVAHNQKFVMKASDKCQTFSGNSLEEILGPNGDEVDRMRLWVLHNYTRTLHSNASADIRAPAFAASVASANPVNQTAALGMIPGTSAVSKRQILNNISQAGDYGAALKGNLALTHYAMYILTPKGGKKNRNRIGEQFVRAECFDQKGPLTWARAIQELEQAMRPVAAACGSTEARNMAHVNLADFRTKFQGNEALWEIKKLSVAPVADKVVAVSDENEFGQAAVEMNQAPVLDETLLSSKPEGRNFIEKFKWGVDLKTCQDFNDHYLFYLSILTYPRDNESENPSQHLATASEGRGKGIHSDKSK